MRPHRLNNRPHLLINIKLNSHSRQRSQNITEQNTPIRLIIPPRLQRNLHGHVGDLTPLPKRGVLLTQIAVLLNVATSLAHHPDGDAFGGFAAGGADEKWVDGFAGGVDVGGGDGLGFARGGEGEGGADGGEEGGGCYQFHCWGVY